jgi:hypothetical protein
MPEEDPQPAGFGLPATFANRFEVKIDGSVSRIVFGDALVGKHAAYHSHVVMKTEDLQALGEAIGEVLAKAKRQK